MNEYINATQQAGQNYINLLNNKKSAWADSLMASSQGLKEIGNELKADQLYSIQKQAMQNQANLSGKQLDWFDRIQNAQQNQAKAQIDNTQAITAGHILQNKFNQETLDNNILATKAKGKEGIALSNLNTTAYDDIRNAKGSDEPRFYDNYKYRIAPDVPSNDPRGRLEIRQTNQLYSKTADTATALDLMFNEMQNYDPYQYGWFDTTLRRYGPKTVDMEKTTGHILRLKSLVKDLIDKGVLNRAEQKEAMSLVDGWTEGGTAQNRKSLIDMFITKYQSQIENLKNRGIATQQDEDTIMALEDKLTRFKNLSDQMQDWDGSTKLTFKNAPFKKASSQATTQDKPISAKELFSNQLNSSNPQEDTTTTKPNIDLSKFYTP
ncbi:hypothetical protein [Helicobacter sp. 13S00477-4]|uniref:hypothetical protein n=1 Tax=Helicobacter sp. 13S00477-4 TaxID=1905759 RepID=UPI000BA5C55D|nr:hypothetical protein [Helicobacter sp. 13S00477-4]PAF52003.1 hypothetical protein BKH44_04915 [Helicobacter sp. 13S00477-4]